MGKIFVIMGPSCSGKDTIFKHIKELNPELIPLIPYTTRPIRAGEENGITYNFISDEQLKSMEENSQIIEKREYETQHGIWTYATASANIDLDNYNYILINTIEGYTKIRDYYGQDTVVPLYINSNPDIRLERALKRERKQEEPKYTEMCRRFIADSIDFDRSKLIAAGINEEYDNNTEIIGTVVANVDIKIKDELLKDKINRR